MIRTLLVDEQKVIREGLRVLLESESDLEIVAAVSNGYAAISKIDETQPDILFISIKLSEIDGLDVLAIIRKKYPDVKIILFSDLADEKHLIQALEMGIRGYLLKDSPMPEIVAAIYAVAEGYIHVANGAFSRIVPNLAKTFKELNEPQPEIVFSDTKEYQELSPWENSESRPGENPDSQEITPYQSKIAPTEIPAPTSEQPILMEAQSITEESSGANLPLEGEQSTELNKNYFSLVTWASFGLLAISLAAISVISRRSPQVVIENAIINGKTIAVESPVEGKLTKVNYEQGSIVDEGNIIAEIEPELGDRDNTAQSQLEAQLELKQQQQTLGQQSLNFLAESLANLELESSNLTSENLTNLLKSLHLNQIKYQEVALQTAKVREDAAKNNYQDLKTLFDQQKISATQLNSAQNSWELAQLAIAEITTNLSNTRREYDLLQQQVRGNIQEQTQKIDREKSRLEQQVSNQKTTLEILKTEIGNLEEKLAQVITEATQTQTLSIQAPIAGAIYNQQYQVGELVTAADAIATIIDCRNLWIEATVDPQVTTKINTQEPVLVTIADRDISLEGKISLIESLNRDQPGMSLESHQTAITTEIPPQAGTENYSKVIVSVPASIEKLNEQQYCSVGQTARLSFGIEKESLISQLQPQWLTKILTISSS